MIYFPRYNIQSLVQLPCSIPNIEQRAGRVGRIKEGIYYGVYTNHVYNKYHIVLIYENPLLKGYAN